MGRQPEIDPVPDAGEFRVMIDFLGMERDPRQESERFAEVLESETSEQCGTALVQGPAFGSFHAVLVGLEMRGMQAQLDAKGDC